MAITIERGDWQPLPLAGGHRAFAIGDVHGVSAALATAFEIVGERAAAGGPDHLVMLGDYIDRGPDSLGVLNLVDRGIAGVRLVRLAGNHEGALAAAVDGDDLRALAIWRDNGGDRVMSELGIAGFLPTPMEVWAAFSEDQRRLIDSLISHYRLGDMLFIHAGVHPDFLTLDEALSYPWRRLPASWSEEQRSPYWVRAPFLSAAANPQGVFVVHGHTPAAAPELKPNRLGLDLGSYYTGRIAVAEIDGDRVRIAVVTDTEQPRRWRLR